MASLSFGDQEETLFLLNEQPPSSLLPSESFDGIKSIPNIMSNTSSITSTPVFNQVEQHMRSLSFHNSTPSVRVPSRDDTTKTIDTFVQHYEQRLDNYRNSWQKEYERTIQKMIETKNHEVEGLKLRYETKFHEFEENNRQLEIRLGQIIEENKRLKIEIEHEKQQNKLEQISTKQNIKELENEMQRKLHETKMTYENEKQELKRQHSKMNQDVLNETNQRLKKMQLNYKYQHSTNEPVIEEMEKRMTDLRTNFEQLQEIKQKLDEEKVRLMRHNERLQLQIQELTSKQHHMQRDFNDKIQCYENELKTIRVRFDSSTELLNKENEILKTKSKKTIDDLEMKLSKITEQFHDMEALFEQKLNEQKMNYLNTLNKREIDAENRIQQLQIEQQNETMKYRQIHDELKQENIRMKNEISEINEKMRENEQIHFRNEENLREKCQQDIDDLKCQYNRINDEKDEKIKHDFQKIDRLSVETNLKHEHEKQKIINEYEDHIVKLKRQYSQKVADYEKNTENLILKTHEQLKSMEDEYEIRFNKQQRIIDDQAQINRTIKDELNQCINLKEQVLIEKSQLREQFDAYVKDLDKNFNSLKTKKKHLEHKLSYLNEQHKTDMIQCRLSYETMMKGLLSNDVRIDLESTIHSLKQQTSYLQQRIAFLQDELDQYTQIYGHTSLPQLRNHI